MIDAFVTWLVEGGLGPALVAFPVTWTAAKAADAARHWFRHFHQTDDISRLVQAVIGGSAALTSDEFDAVRRLLEDRTTWAVVGSGTVDDLVTKIASCLPPSPGRTADDSRAIAMTIARGLVESGIADVDPKIFQRLLLARLQRVETNQASRLDRALLRQEASLSALLAGQDEIEIELFTRMARALDRMLGSLPPGPADRDGVAVYLRALIMWLSSDPWPQHRRFGGAAISPPVIERRLRIASGKPGQEKGADDLAQRCERLVVLGGPGCGKTWLARRIARRCAQKALRALAGGATLSQVELPVYTTCSRLFAAEGDIRTAIVFSALNQLGDMGGSRISTAVATLLAERHAPTLVVIDSLDEARGSDERLRQADTLPWRIVLTSRPSSWDNQLAISGNDKTHCVGELQPLRYPGDVDSFIRRWFSGQPEQGAIFAGQIAQRPSLQQTVTVPLILALYCVIGGGGEPLPEFRRDLYDKVLACLLTGRWRGRGSEPNARACLKQLTEWAWTAAASDPVARIGIWEDDVLTGNEQIDQANRGALDHVAVPLGPPDLYEGTILRRFIHRSIREHLVGRHIAALPVDEAVEVLLPHLWYDPDWENAAADAIAGHRQRDQLVLHLIRSANSDAETDDATVIDAGGQFQMLLSRVASESKESDWQPAVAKLIDQARVELARWAPPGSLSRAAHWPTSNRLVRERLLLLIRRPSFFRDPSEGAGDLAKLDPTPEERQQAIEALLERWPKSCDDFADVSINSLGIADAVIDIAQTPDERQYVLKAMLTVFAGPPSYPHCMMANVLTRDMVKLAPTADERRQAREMLMSFAATVHHGVQAQPWVDTLFRFGPTGQDKQRAREVVLSLISAQSSGLYTDDMTRALLQLEPTRQDRQQAREALLRLISAQPTNWRSEYAAKALLQLGPTEAEKRQARDVLVSQVRARGMSRDIEKLVRALIRLDLTEHDRQQARDALISAMAASESHGDVKAVASGLVKLAVTADEKHLARRALLDLMQASHTGDGVAAMAAALAKLGPTEAEKRQARDVLVSQVRARGMSRDIEKLVRALIRLDLTEHDRQQARDALISAMAASESHGDVKAVASGLVKLAVTADEKHLARRALLDLMQASRTGDGVAAMAAALAKLGPTEAEKRQAREILVSNMPYYASPSDSDRLTALAQLAPTIDDISTWRDWSQQPTSGLLAAVRRNSTLDEWLAALVTFPGLEALKSSSDKFD